MAGDSAEPAARGQMAHPPADASRMQRSPTRRCRVWPLGRVLLGEAAKIGWHLKPSDKNGSRLLTYWKAMLSCRGVNHHEDANRHGCCSVWDAALCCRSVEHRSGARVELDHGQHDRQSEPVLSG